MLDVWRSLQKIGRDEPGRRFVPYALQERTDGEIWICGQMGKTGLTRISVFCISIHNNRYSVWECTEALCSALNDSFSHTF